MRYAECLGQAPHTAADANVMQPRAPKCVGATQIVMAAGIASVDDHVSHLQQGCQRGEDRIDGSGRRHYPDRAPRGKTADEGFERALWCNQSQPPRLAAPATN